MKRTFLWFIYFFLVPVFVFSQENIQRQEKVNAVQRSQNNRAASPLCIAPPISVSPGSSLICNPGGAAVSLTAMGATTYSWSPSTGLSATTGSVVTANPSSTTTYTITGTDDFGCIAVTTATVTVGSKPVLVPAATPSTVCPGGNATLNANASIPALTYCTPTYLTGTGQGDYIGLVQIATTTLNNTTTGAATPYYTLFPASGSTTASLAANTAYNMSVKGGTFGTCFIRGWIDYNQDGIFTASESIGVSPNVGASTTGIIGFSIPLTAINGATRLRLRSSDSPPGPGTGDFCNGTNTAFGETEDYVITITGAVAQITYLWSPASFLSGTTSNPTTASSVSATTTYTVTATRANGCNANANVTVTVNIISITNPATTTGTSGTAFSQTFTQTGAIGGATFTLNTGTLPTGLTLSTAGILSGTPTQTGSFPLTIKVTGGNGCVGIGATYTLLISAGCPNITVSNPATTTGTTGTAFNQTFTQTGAVAGATFTLFSGTLPTGLTLSTTGLLSGTPTQGGAFPVTVRVTDGNTCTGTGTTYNLVINCPTITVSNPATTTGTAGTAFSQTFTQTGATGGATFTLTTGTLPTGLSLTTAGVLSGTATQTGSFPITVRVTSGHGCIGTGSSYPLVISCQTVTVTNPGTSSGTAGAAFNKTFTQTGGIGAVNFTLNSGTLPTGLALSLGGVLSGTPTQTGSFAVTIRATDANGCFGNGTTYTIVISCQTVTVTNAGTSSGTAGAAFSKTFTQTGGIGAVNFTLNSGTLPTGLSISSAGVLSGTPTQTGSFPVTIRATDANGCFGNGTTYTIVISCQTVTVTNPGTSSGTAGAAFSKTFTQTGGIGAVNFTLNSGTFPTGLSISSAGVLSGTPTQTGSFPVTIRATDANGCFGNGTTYTIVISCQTVTVTNAGTSSGTAGAAFSKTFTQTGGIGAVNFTLNSGTLPTGLALSSGGILSGTPTQTGSFPVTIRATDANGCFGNGITYTIVISCQTVTVTNPGTSPGTVGAAFSQTFTQTGGIGAVNFTLNSGSLPTGLTLSSTGVLAGTPTQAGSFPITVRATDANGCFGNGASYTLLINAATITVNFKLFLEGYYLSAGNMQPVLNNQAVPSSLPTQADTIMIDLHHATTFALVDSKKAVLQTNGIVSATFTQPAASYYIAIRHRNSVKTWSANPIACSASTALYDFSTAANKAYGSNQKLVQAGIWAFYCGDLNQDEFVDGNDFPAYDIASANGLNGVYAATDMNGDGFVDGNDYPVFDLNSSNSVSSIHP